jgi:hypothetical protein
MTGLNDGRSWEWKGDRLYLNRRLSGYSVVTDEKYPGVMWRVRSPDGKLSAMVNRTRAKDAAMAMLDRDLRYGEKPAEPVPMR